MANRRPLQAMSVGRLSTDATSEGTGGAPSRRSSKALSVGRISAGKTDGGAWPKVQLDVRRRSKRARAITRSSSAEMRNFPDFISDDLLAKFLIQQEA